MEKSMYKNIQERTLNDHAFHNRLIEEIENLRECELEKSLPNYKFGQTIYPLDLFLKNSKARQYLSSMVYFDKFLEKNLFPAIKFDLCEFVKN
jgi:hypothetical protein